MIQININQKITTGFLPQSSRELIHTMDLSPTQFRFSKFKNSHLSFPITINYSSKNITVQSEAPPEGTGWQLTAGGSISREINGHTDLVLAMP